MNLLGHYDTSRVGFVEWKDRTQDRDALPSVWRQVFLTTTRSWDVSRLSPVANLKYFRVSPFSRVFSPDFFIYMLMIIIKNFLLFNSPINVFSYSVKGVFDRPSSPFSLLLSGCCVRIFCHLISFRLFYRKSIPFVVLDSVSLSTHIEYHPCLFDTSIYVCIYLSIYLLSTY